MIFQEPMTSLTRVTAGIRCRSAIIHQHCHAGAARARAIEMLRLVGFPIRGRRPLSHQLSGRHAQRVMIAMALVCHPRS